MLSNPRPSKCENFGAGERLASFTFECPPQQEILGYKTMVDWTRESVSQLSQEALKSLRENAHRLQKMHVVELCDAELESRKPIKIKRTIDGGSRESRRGHYVSGFHFVCPRENDVTTNSDGTISTGTWVVDKKVAQQSAKYGAYVALHKVRSEVSYLQGVLKDFRIKRRDRENADGEPVGTEYGIEFLLEPTNDPYQWKGDGSGEKGYQWSAIP